MFRLRLILPLIPLLVAPPARADDAMSTVLATLGWTDERLERLASDEPLAADDTRDLLLLASRLERFADQLRADADGPNTDAPLGPVLITAQVTSVEATQVGEDPTALPWLRIAASADDRPLTVLANEAPRAWREPGVLPQPAELIGLRVREGVVLAIAWRWTPDKPAYPHVNFGESVLGSLGVDVGSLDRLIDGGRLRAVESAPFYAVLSAMREIGAHQLARFARGNLPTYAQQWPADPESPLAEQALAREVAEVAGEGRYPIAPLFNDALRQRGELYVLEGVARRAVAIEAAAAAGERSVSAEHGVRRYYEIELFTPDSRNLPIVFCTLEVPEGFPLGDKIEVPVQAAGFSIKRWAYRTRQRRPDGEDKPQLAPLLIGRAPIMLAPASGQSPAWGIAAGVAFVAAIGLVWLVVWRTNRRDARFEREARGRSRVDAEQLARLADSDGLPSEGPSGQNEGP